MKAKASALDIETGATLAIPRSMSYHTLEWRFVPAAYQGLVECLLLLVTLASFANILALAMVRPGAIWLLPIVAALYVWALLLGARQVPVPRVRGIVSLQDLASAIVEKRSTHWGWRGCIRHRTVRHGLFLVIVAMGSVIAIVYAVLYPEQTGHGSLSTSTVAELLLAFGLLVVMPIAYVLVVTPKRGSALGACLACAVTLFAGGFLALGVGELATTIVSPAVQARSVPLAAEQGRDLLTRLKQQLTSPPGF